MAENSGQLPLPVGQPLHIKSVTAAERKILEGLGWKSGDPVPTNLPEVLASIEEAPVSPKQPSQPFVPPKTVDLSDLPEDAQLQYLKSVKELMAATKQLTDAPAEDTPEVPDGLGPGLRDAIIMGSKPAPEAPKEEQPKEPAHKQCVNCGWEQDKTEVFPVTEEDKQIFIQALLGGLPFQKTYTLFGNRLQIVMRSLTSNEIDLCSRQRFIDREKNRTLTPMDDVEMYTRYRAMLQTSRIVLGQTVHTMPATLPQWEQTVAKTADADDTIVRHIYEHFYSNVCSAEYLQRAVLQVAMNFIDTVRRLEANANSPDFWNATDSRG